MMRNFLACLLLLSCLVTHRATAQAVVRLLPGDCIDRPMLGLDSATYYTTLDRIDSTKQVLATAKQRFAALEYRHALSRDANAALTDELGRCRTEGVAKDATITRLGVAATKAYLLPIQPPLLFDSRFYKGAAVGGGAAVVVATLLKVFVFKH